MEQIIEAEIYWNDEPDEIFDVLFGVGIPPDREDYEHDHKIFYYLDYPEEINDFTKPGISEFTVVSHQPPVPITEIFI